MYLYDCLEILFACYGDNRGHNELTPSCPARRSSDLMLKRARRVPSRGRRVTPWCDDGDHPRAVGGPHRSGELLPAQRTRHGVGRQSAPPRGGGRMHETSSTDAPTGRGTQDPSFIPALRFAALPPPYDPLVRLTTRQPVAQRALLDAARLGPAVR